MTYRRPMTHKWFYPFVVVGFLWLGYIVLTTADPMDRHGHFSTGIGIALFGAFCGVVLSFMVGTSQVVVDERGIRWKEGADVGDFNWNQITSLVQDGDSVGLRERGSARIIKLPFVTRPLYEMLAGRLNRLTPEEERILFS